MPSMFHGLGDSDLEAVVAYLGTMGDGIKFERQRHANAERGSALYHEKGCVACHAPTGDYRGPKGTVQEVSGSKTGDCASRPAGQDQP